MKIAIVHDYIKEYGGAERVLESLLSIFPDAHVYTLVYLPSFLGPHRERFKKFKIHTSILQHFPLRSKMISPFRLIASRIFKNFDFSSYDLIIVSQTGAYYPNAIDKKNAVQVCYCHTPPRYLYGYATAREWKKNIAFRILGEIANHFLRMTDYKASRNVDYFIANSQNVKKRIEKFYRRQAEVIYPPVQMNGINPLKKSTTKEYYLAGGRLARPKNIDLIVRTFSKNNLPLRVFGTGFAGYGDELKKIAGSKVELLGEISDQKKLELMANAKAFVFASEDEDLGIIPIEAMSVGTPVICYASGGVLETVINEKTGFFFNELTEKSLLNVIKKFEKEADRIKSQDCIKQAGRFSEEVFEKKIVKFIKDLKIYA